MKRFLEAPYRFALCWTALLLTAFGWALLDTFVIPHRELAEKGMMIKCLTPPPFSGWKRNTC